MSLPSSEVSVVFTTGIKKAQTGRQSHSLSHVRSHYKVKSTQPQTQHNSHTFRKFSSSAEIPTTVRKGTLLCPPRPGTSRLRKLDCTKSCSNRNKTTLPPSGVAKSVKIHPGPVAELTRGKTRGGNAKSLVAPTRSANPEEGTVHMQVAEAQACNLIQPPNTPTDALHTGRLPEEAFRMSHIDICSHVHDNTPPEQLETTRLTFTPEERRQILKRFINSVLGAVPLNTSFTFMYPIVANSLAIQTQLGRPSWLAEAWNRIMHSINGNRDPAAKERKKATKKKSPAKKAATKEKRRKQLTKQVEFLQRAQKAATTVDEAKALGRVIKGRGDYSMGQNIGSKIGGFLGGKLHEWIKKITGFGDYEIQGQPAQNSLLAKDSTPSFRSQADGGTRIQFEEYLGYLPVNQNFTRTSFPLDPTSRSTFPWSWQISKRFQQYILRGMVVVIKSNMSPLTTSGVIGTIFGSVRYNVDAPPPSSKSEVMNTQFCESESANKNLILAIECAPDQTIWPLKIRQNGMTTGEEQLYELGILDVCSQGAQADYPNGAEAYAIYDLELLKPRIGSGAPVEMFMADLTSGDFSLPLRMVPSTPLVPQPRVNSLGLLTTAAGVVTFPYDVPVGSVYKLTSAYNIGMPTGGDITTGSYMYTVAMNFYNNQAQNYIAPHGANGGPWPNYSISTVQVIKILAGATFAEPPSFKIGVTGGLPTSGGIIILEETDPRICSGLTALPPKPTQRNKFLNDLRGLKETGVYHGTPLDLRRMRLVDYVEAFRSSFSVNINALTRSSEVHEITLDHAIERLSIYESTSALACLQDDEKTQLDEDTWVHQPHVAAHLNGAQGSWTGTDDVETKNAADSRKLLEMLAELDPEENFGLDRVMNLNPPGLTGPLTLLVNTGRARNSLGWANPALGIIIMTDRIAIWDSPPTLLKRNLQKRAPKGVWNIDKLRLVQCFAMHGETCKHAAIDCPAYTSILRDILVVGVPKHVELVTNECSTLNGNNGSATNTDDVELAACDLKCCLPHMHLKKRKHSNETATVPAAGQESKTQPQASGGVEKDTHTPEQKTASKKPGAELRIAIANSRKLTMCMHNGVCIHTIDGVCPIRPMQSHWHGDNRKTDLHPETPEEAAENGDKTLVNNMLTKIVKERAVFGMVHDYGWPDEVHDEQVAAAAFAYAERNGGADPHGFAMDAARIVNGKAVGIDVAAIRWQLHPAEYEPPAELEPPRLHDEGKHADPAPEVPQRDGADSGTDSEESSEDDADFNPFVAQLNEEAEIPNYDRENDQPARPNELANFVEAARGFTDTAAQRLHNIANTIILDPHPPAPPLRTPLAIDERETADANMRAATTLIAIRRPGLQIGNEAPRLAELIPTNGFETKLNHGAPIRQANDEPGARLLGNQYRIIDPRPVVSNLVNKARTLWLRRNPSKPSDRSDVLHSLSNITRQESIHEAIPTIDSMIVDISEQAARRAVQTRIRAAENRVVRHMPQWERWYNIMIGNSITLSDGKPDMALLETLEAMKPYCSASATLREQLAALVLRACLAIGIVVALIKKFNSYFLMASKCRLVALSKPYSYFAKYYAKAHVTVPLYIAGVAPLFEETLKYLLSVALTQFGIGMLAARLLSGATFGIIEARAFGAVPNRQVALMLYGMKIFQHAAFSCKGFRVGLILHSAWNFSFLKVRTQAHTQSEWNALARTYFGAVHHNGAITPVGEQQNESHARYNASHNCITDVCVGEDYVAAPPVQDDFRMKVKEYECKGKHGATGYWGIKGYVGTVFRTCTCNEINALQGRVGKRLPIHLTADRYTTVLANFNRLSQNFCKLLKDLHMKLTIKPMDFMQWIDTFEPTRRELLLRIWRDQHDMPQLRASSFVKKEIAVKPEKDPGFKTPRLIQGCPPELSMATGPYLRKFAHSIRDTLEPNEEKDQYRDRQVYYTCGRNAQEVGNALRDAIKTVESRMGPMDRLVFVEDDQSRFDLHMGEGAFSLLNSVYAAYLPKKVRKLLRRTNKSRGTTSTGIRYSVPYTMQSGWPDTSVGDTIVNAAMKYDIHGRGRNWISIICGDDSVTVTTQSEVDRMGGAQGMIHSYAMFGMEVTIDIRTSVHDVNFCSARFYPASGSFILMPKPGKILAKICWDMKVRNYADRMIWLRSIACTLDLYGKVDPLIASLATMLHEFTGTGRTLNLVDAYKFYVGTTPALRPTPEDVAIYYEHNYGMSLYDIEHVESVILGSTIGQFLDDPLLVRMAAHDV